MPWNDEEAVADAIAQVQPAAVIAEPIPANMGVVPPDPGFLEHLRDATAEAGALLVLDEVISGFRVARGGAQELLGVEADLTVMGKVIGGGLPAAAYGGPRELMERIAPAGDVYQAGTLSGNPLAVAADSRPSASSTAPPTSGSRRSPSGSPTACARRPVTGPSRWRAFPAWSPSSSPPTRSATSRARAACDTDAYGRFCRALLERGVYPPASQFEAWFPSLAHDDEAIGRDDRGGGRGLSRSHLSSAPLTSRFRMASTGTSLAPLAALLRDGENVIAPHVTDSDEEPALGALAAAGPRAAEAPGEYLLLVEAIREGYLLHYESPD